MPQWIAARLAAQGQRVVAGEEGQRTLQFFADRVEGNLLAAHQEIQKLALLHPAGELCLDLRQIGGQFEIQESVGKDLNVGGEGFNG